MRPVLAPLAHEAISVFGYWTGLRDRLRCPSCSAVGTWKPHGSRFDGRHGDLRVVRRWLCKWCGHYVGPEGVCQAFPSRSFGEWRLEVDTARGPFDVTPAEAVAQAYDRTPWPWRG